MRIYLIKFIKHNRNRNVSCKKIFNICYNEMKKKNLDKFLDSLSIKFCI